MVTIGLTGRQPSQLQILKPSKLSNKEKCDELFRALTSAIRLESFPTFCATLVGGSTLFPYVILRLCDRLGPKFGPKADVLKSAGSVRLVRLLTAFISAWFSFAVLNRKPVSLQGARSKSQSSPEDATTEGKYGSGIGTGGRPHTFGGRTMDLTLFSLTRAVDLVACIAWARWRIWRKSQRRWTAIERMLPKLVDAGVFATSAAIVMWAWFYLPERLPRSYEKWIGEVAKVDIRLIEALRRARMGTFVYGKETGQAPLLQSMCKDYAWPLEWGDPKETTPIPCEMVHMGCGPNCEKHAASRFAKTFKFACATYIPLQIVFRLRSMKSAQSLRRAVSDALRSSAFLASFVTLFYYGVCLARTRVGPKIFKKETVTPLMWDSGLCVGVGCLMCGWSILVESARKRQEIALFVAPRAVATVLPRFYHKKYQYRERVTFAISAAILFTCLQERPSMVRGVFGRIGAGVVK
ncbi:hypothetical protein FE257_009896 [Aspergillus nanangensis]|uniref:Integral membrane protein n=1 Tax=Aspergillus nanangensis TaxID=2582783 RepID=A0AAD4GYA9_ASPNN|nr:hypothetical protein FE257_009896 [Aspergillus nanangensis]